MSKAHKGPFSQLVYFLQPNVACPVTAFMQYAKVVPNKRVNVLLKWTAILLTGEIWTICYVDYQSFLTYPTSISNHPTHRGLVEVPIFTCLQCQCTKLKRLVDGLPSF